MRPSTDILVLHDGDAVGAALEAELAARGIGCRRLPGDAPVEGIVDAALGCRGIIASGAAVGMEFPHLLAATALPGLRALVLVPRGEHDLSALRRSGAPYTVLRPAPLLEELAAALEPALAAGRLTLARDDDPALAWVAARDVARVGVAAVDADAACGATLDVAAPERPTLSALATRLAAATGRTLKIRRFPRWALGPLRALGITPFALPRELVSARDGAEAAEIMGGAWTTIEEVAAASGPSPLARPPRIAADGFGAGQSDLLL